MVDIQSERLLTAVIDALFGDYMDGVLAPRV
jgi:hypothetical protein